MQVFLLQTVPKLGQKGEVKNVSDGYARNFLFPKKWAQPATESLIRTASEQKVKKQSSKTEALSVLQKSLTTLTEALVFKRPATGETLFGSVSAKDIAQTLSEKGIPVSEKNIDLSHPLKHLGKTIVSIVLSGKKVGQVVVEIVKK